MNNIRRIIYSKLGIQSDRTKNITKHIGLSVIYKGGSIVANFLLVPLTMNFLDKENYGVWLTLSSFIAWFSFFDIGLGNGLRNKFAEAKAKGDMTLARGYVSSAYFTIGAVCLGLILIFTLINFFIDWTKVFNASPGLQKDLSLLMPIVFGFFCLQLVFKLITTIYTADQHHSINGKINFFIQVSSLTLIWILAKTSKGSLLAFGTIFSILPVFLLIIINILAFRTKYADFKPSYRFCTRNNIQEIFSLGITFFIIQIAGIILYSTDNYLIAYFFSPEEVIPYSLAYKYIGLSSMAFSIVATPYWSSITDAYNKSDFLWLKTSMQSFVRLSYLFILVVIILVLFSESIFEVWVGSKVEIAPSLTIYIAIFFFMNIIVTPYTVFLNGVGKIRLQAMQSLLVSLLNIPISYILAIQLHFGVNGIILATIICFIPSIPLSQIQYKKLINGKAKSIWNE